MVLKYLDGNRITGKFSERPVSTTTDTTDPITSYSFKIPTGTEFTATDTGERSIFNGTAWIHKTYESINQALGHDKGSIQKQHFVDCFMGIDWHQKLWTWGSSVGTPAFTPSLEVDGGQIFTTSASSSHSVVLDMANKHQFSASGCEFIIIFKIPDTNAGYFYGGLGEDSNLYAEWSTSQSNYRLNHRRDDTATSGTSSSVTRDANWHVHRCRTDGITANYKIDGVLEVTTAYSIPINQTGSLEPTIQLGNSGGVAKSMHLRYYEAWNY